MVEKKKERQEILLESGTNEVEVIEFILAGHRFCVNVAKVKQLVPFEASKMSLVPLGPETVLGLYPFREATIPVIDLEKAFPLTE